MSEYVIKYPEGYEQFSWEYEAKGWVGGVLLFYDGKEYELNFYSPERLAQEIGDELKVAPVFYESNLLIIPEIDVLHIVAAVDRLVKTGKVRRFFHVSGGK